MIVIGNNRRMGRIITSAIRQRMMPHAPHALAASASTPMATVPWEKRRRTAALAALLAAASDRYRKRSLGLDIQPTARHTCGAASGRRHPRRADAVGRGANGASAIPGMRDHAAANPFVFRSRTPIWAALANVGHAADARTNRWVDSRRRCRLMRAMRL